MIDILKDGKWHTLSDISQQINVHEFKIETLIGFLANYSFLQLERKKKKARLSRIFEEFLKKTESLETS